MDSFVTDLADLRSEVRIGNAATANVNASIQVLSAKVDVISAQQQLSAAQATAEARAREGQSISNARLFAMAASAATIAGFVVALVNALRVSA